MTCQARGCAKDTALKSEVWCLRHRRIVVGANKELAIETEDAMRHSPEWRAAVRAAQELILQVDKEAARQMLLVKDT